jgi:hypothetical protein
LEKQDIIGSWFVLGSDESSSDFLSLPRRVEFFPDGTAAEYWGATREETLKLTQHSTRTYEIARGTWRIKGEVLHISFKFGTEWRDRAGSPMRTASAKWLQADVPSLSVTYKITATQLGEGWKKPDTYTKRDDPL